MMHIPMKLGIACVYFYGPDGGWILDLQLQYISRTLSGCDYTVYAGANRLQSALREKLRVHPHVKVAELPSFDGSGGREHGFYLDLLLRQAVKDGCTHVAALDSDSFPVLPDWPQHLLEHMGSAMRIAAVLRCENGDTHLPHPCGYFMHRSFLLDRDPQLYPSETDLASADFQKFLSTTGQRVDTGIGYAYALWKSGEPWLPLPRSNRLNPHFLMAGIYGGVFFHLGASARRPSFHLDYTTRPSLRLAARLRQMPLLWRAGDLLEDRYLAENERTFRGIATALRSDPDRFLTALQSTHPSEKA